jgi:adenylyltransferase/sulfurtransferase
MDKLSTDEVLRYQRHLTLPGFGEAAQLKLKAARVLVIGAGGLGCPALLYLAAAGVGTIGIVDDDVVSFSNLQRQILFLESDVGRQKAQVAAERLSAMNSQIQCVPHVMRFSPGNALGLLEQYDYVLDGSDNFPTRYLINDACVLAGKPLVYGALYTFQGQVSVFNYRGGPTYRCLFPVPPRPEDAPSCSEIGVLGVLPGMIATLQATELIKLITEVGEPLSGKLLLYDALKMSHTIVAFDRVPEQAQVEGLDLIEYQCATPQLSSVCEVSVQELAQESRPYQLIDVRENWERQICSIAGSFHVPLDHFSEAERDATLAALDPNCLTYLYCKLGSRSLRAAELLQARLGFKAVRSVRGGILAWAKQNDPEMALY